MYWLIIIIVIIFLYFSEYNTLNIDGFNVRQRDSALMLLEVDRRITKLKAHMNAKYRCGSCNPTVERFNMRDRTAQLFENYNTANIFEISPNNLLGNTSFTQQKKKDGILLAS